MAPRQKFNPRTGKFEEVTPPVKAGDAEFAAAQDRAAAAREKAKSSGPSTKFDTPTGTTLPTRQYASNDTRTDTRPKAPAGKTKSKVVGAYTPVPRTDASGRSGAGATGPPSTVLTPKFIEDIVTKVLNGETVTPQEQALFDAYLNEGGSGPSAAQKAAEEARKNADSYRAGMSAADIQAQAGTDAQTQYGALAQTAYNNAKTAADNIYTPAVGDTNTYYDTQIANLQKYIDTQRTSATGAIDTATTDLLAGLKGTSAYQDASVANVAAPTQGLGDMLAAYGGTGQSAQEQQNMDAATSKQIADLFGRSNKQLAGAETDYYTGLQNAARGAQAAGKSNLATVLATLQGQDKAGIEGNRRAELAGLQASRTAAQGSATDLQNQLLAKGIDAVMSGKQAAATTRAQTTASYGVPKKKGKAVNKPKLPTKPKK